MDSLRVQVSLADEIAKNGMTLINSGRIRNHKLGNTARAHTGEEEKKEYQTYRDFLLGKNCCMIYELTGSDCYEEY